MNRKIKMLIFLLAAFCLSASVCTAADHWTSVQNAGVIRVGTSSDYIPFVYTEGTELDGLDIALVKEMANRLGLGIQVVDIAFDGLIDAAIIGQIDLIACAYAITEGRSEKLDFTNAYYQAGGIFLCRENNKVTEDVIRDAKIGVQKGSSFEQWIASNLLMSGKMSQANVYTYSKVNEIVNALKKGDVDVILIDEDVYRSQYKADTTLAEVNNQPVNEKYGFAAVKGSTLIPQLNTVMREMFLDGTAQKIANKYFAMDFSDRIDVSITRPAQMEEYTEPVPEDMVISREITMEDVTENVRANNAPTCLNGMMFISDVSLPDRTILIPNLNATKTWNIKNTGTCTWDSTYTFNYVKGAVLGPTSVQIDKLVAPGESYQISVDMVTPGSNGEYTSWWQMRTGSGTNFGETIWFDIIVSASSGSSDQKVQTTPKILKWYPAFYTTDNGGCPRIYYEVTDAYQVEFYINNSFAFSSRNLSGYTFLCTPKKAGTYTLAIRAVGETAISDAFQFVDQTYYPPENIGKPAEYPHPTLKKNN